MHSVLHFAFQRSAQGPWSDTAPVREELFGIDAPAAKTARAGKTSKSASKAGRKVAKVAPKYRNPANAEETWTGRGKQPRWLAEYTNNGRKVEEFLIQK